MLIGFLCFKSHLPIFQSKTIFFFRPSDTYIAKAQKILNSHKCSEDKNSSSDALALSLSLMEIEEDKENNEASDLMSSSPSIIVLSSSMKDKSAKALKNGTNDGVTDPREQKKRAGSSKTISSALPKRRKLQATK